MAATRSITYDDSQLQRLFEQMDEKQRAKAMKGGFRSAAQVLKRASVNWLRKDLKSNRDLEKGIRALVFKEKLGFRVTVGTVVRRAKNRMGWEGVTGFHHNRHGLDKPVLIWAEDGTAERRLKGTRGSHKTKRGFRKRYLYNGAYRGRMKAYQFLVKGQGSAGPQINATLQSGLRASVEKTAKKYGCTV